MLDLKEQNIKGQKYMTLEVANQAVIDSHGAITVLNMIFRWNLGGIGRVFGGVIMG